MQIIHPSTDKHNDFTITKKIERYGDIRTLNTRRCTSKH